MSPAPQPVMAQVFDLADWRKVRSMEGAKPEARPAFEVSEGRPGLDVNTLGHWLKALATVLRNGAMDKAEVAARLDGLSANAHAACRQYLDVESDARIASQLACILAPELSELEGAELFKAIRAKVKAHRTAAYWSKRKGGKPAPKARKGGAR